MARQVDMKINVNTGNAISSINTVKKAFQELNKAYEKNLENGKFKLKVEFDSPDLKLITDISKAFNRLNKSLDKYKENNIALSSTGTNFTVNMNKISDSVIKYGENTDKAIKKQKTFIQTLVENVSKFEILRRSFLAYSNDFLQLTDATYGVGVAGQMNMKQIDMLNASFLKLSRTIPATANELANAVNDLIRTGRGYEESRKIIEQVAILSTASGDSLKDTAQVVTKVMVSLGINSDRVKDTLNTMHSTAIQTASDMKYLSEAYKNVAGTTAVFATSSGLAGKELDDYKQKLLDLTMAGTGSFANLGLSASQTGTKLKQVFGRMVG